MLFVLFANLCRWQQYNVLRSSCEVRHDTLKKKKKEEKENSFARGLL